MFTIRRPPMLVTAIILAALAAGAVLAVYFLYPGKGGSTYQKPAQPYDYYYIYAEEDGRELMRVPLAISIDDELITEDNKRYKVIKVEGDKGIARYVEDVNLEKYKSQ